MTITRTNDAGGICLLTFDREGAAANLFDRATLGELDAHVAALEQESGVTGIVLASGKPGIFIAGADLNAFGRNPSEEELGGLVDLGQRVFTRLSRLSVPSVAAIRGACLGGGLELALACDWRVAADDRATKLGFPETQLGILPAWGGSTRLPRRIGLPRALSLILTGKPVAGSKARKLGLVDDLVHAEYLIDAARKLVALGKRLESRAFWLNRAPFSWIVAGRARRQVLAKTRGHYPAPLAALEVCEHAASGPLERGLRREKEAFLALAGTPECRALLSLFFLQERAKRIAAAGSAGAIPARRIAVIGAGTMGAGIAQWASSRGFPVLMKDVDPKVLARGLRTIDRIYAEAVSRGVFSRAEAGAGRDGIVPVHADVPLRNVDLVIEAATEVLDVKKRIFADLDARVGPETVLATNTSALSIDEIASGLSHPERVVGLHFFNPVHRMQLVEVVRGPRTSDRALATAIAFAKAIGKPPVVARDSPGFLVNRILMPYLLEAVLLFREGAPAQAIDRSMLDFGMPMGPLRLCDEVGLDVTQHVAKDLEGRLPGAEPIGDTLVRMIAKGWLGKKSGRGFYLYGARSGKAEPNMEVGAIDGTGGLRPPAPSVWVDRLVLPMVNEGAKVLEEAVVKEPDDVDFGMVMGTGWAPFRGGPLRYADSRGAGEVVRVLRNLAQETGPRFKPCSRLVAMARFGGRFYEKGGTTPGRRENEHEAVRAEAHEPAEAA